MNGAVDFIDSNVLLDTVDGQAPAGKRRITTELVQQALYDEALRLQAKLGHGFHDSLIVAAASAAGCKRLLTEDLPLGRRIGSLRAGNPFR